MIISNFSGHDYRRVCILFSSFDSNSPLRLGLLYTFSFNYDTNDDDIGRNSRNDSNVEVR